MAIQPAFGADPAAVDPNIPMLMPNGEMIIGVSDPIGLAPGNTTFYLARRMRFDGGVYQVKAIADDAATWWIGESFTSTRTVFGHDLGQQVAEGEFYIPRGVQRFDIILQNLPEPPTPCYVIFSIYQDGKIVYLSNAEGWLFDTKPIPDEALPPLDDPRLEMPVWTVAPNWKDGVRERLSWLTDVMKSETGAEQRRSLRADPRRSIEASFLRKGADRARMDLFFAGVGHFTFLVPLWHEAVKMVEGITIGASGVSFSAATAQAREFRTGDLVLVNNGNPDDYNILQVAEVEETRFGWRVLPERAWPAGTRIYPLREVRFIESPQISTRGDRVGQVQARFEMLRADKRTPAWGGVVFDDLPVFPFKPNRRSDAQIDYARTTYTLDNSTSRPLITDPGGHTTMGVKLAFTLFGRPQVAALRSLLAAARGRANRFWMPTFTHDIEPLSHIEGGVHINAVPMGMVPSMPELQPTRSAIMIQLTNGEQLYRKILNVTPIPIEDDPLGRLLCERLTLDGRVETMSRDSIERISFMSPARFDQDSVELHHVTAGSYALEMQLVMRQMFDRRDGGTS